MKFNQVFEENLLCTIPLNNRRVLLPHSKSLGRVSNVIQMLRSSKKRTQLSQHITYFSNCVEYKAKTITDLPVKRGKTHYLFLRSRFF